MKKAVLLIAAICVIAGCASNGSAGKTGGSGKAVTAGGHEYDPDLGWRPKGDFAKPSAPKLFRAARKLYEENNYYDAFRKFEEVILNYPKEQLAPNAYFYMGECLYKLEYYREAHDIYRSLIRNMPSFERIREVTQREYEIAFEYLHGHSDYWLIFSYTDPEFGVDILRKLVADFPYEPFAPVAYYQVAEFYVREERYQDAVDTYSALVAKYGESDQGDLAAFKVGACYEKMHKGIDYDVRSLVKAKNSYRRFIELYPSSANVARAKKRIGAIDETLARKLMKTAAFYVRDGRPESARMYYLAVTREFPETKAAKEAGALLGKMKPPPAKKTVGKGAPDGS